MRFVHFKNLDSSWRAKKAVTSCCVAGLLVASYPITANSSLGRFPAFSNKPEFRPRNSWLRCNPNYSFKRNRNRTDYGPLNSGVRRKQYSRGGAYVSSHHVWQQDACSPSPALAWSCCQSRRRYFPDLLTLPAPNLRVAASDHPVYAAGFRGERWRHQRALHHQRRRSSGTICLTIRSSGTATVCHFLFGLSGGRPLTQALGP